MTPADDRPDRPLAEQLADYADALRAGDTPRRPICAGTSRPTQRTPRPSCGCCKPRWARARPLTRVRP
jgi:hypothetical protein